jgi:RNA polymerase sigma-70 factor (ECF subfamily)
MSDSDAELVGRVRRGDLAAYTQLMTRHRAGLERYAHHLLGSREEAEDALQDTLLRAYRPVRAAGAMPGLDHDDSGKPLPDPAQPS